MSTEPLQIITDEIEHALKFGVYYLAITASLKLPDICGALEAADGRATSERYRQWYDAWMGDKYPELASADCYSLRCGVLHQGRMGHPKMPYSRVLFTLPVANRITMHQCVANDALNLDAVEFCRDMVSAVSRWWEAKSADPVVQSNIPRLVKFRPQGLAPYVVGLPLIA